MSGQRPAWVDEIFEELVDRPIHEDRRTTSVAYLGYPTGRIFTDVLEGGQADFDAPLGELSPDDRALLYARFNQRGHFDELFDAFTQLMADLPGAPAILDLGCGPFTAGLAFAAVLGPDRPFRYWGIDRARSMTRLGRSFAEACRAQGRLHRHTTISFKVDLDRCNFGAKPSGDMVVAVASYLLASSSVDAARLAQSLVEALQRIGPGPAAVLYTNSAKGYLNLKFPAFSEHLQDAGFRVHEEGTSLFTRTKTARQIRYALLYREASMDVPMGAP